MTSKWMLKPVADQPGMMMLAAGLFLLLLTSATTYAPPGPGFLEFFPSAVLLAGGLLCRAPWLRILAVFLTGVAIIAAVSAHQNKNYAEYWQTRHAQSHAN